MSLDIYFVYKSQEKERLEVREISCRNLQMFFEYPALAGIENSVFNPPFVQDLPKLQDATFEEIDFDTLSDEEYEEILEPYVGPTFDGEELLAWAEAWSNILPDLSIEQRRALDLISAEGYDWAPNVLEDLRHLAQQAECAERHNIKMHIEMY